MTIAFHPTTDYCATEILSVLIFFGVVFILPPHRYEHIAPLYATMTDDDGITAPEGEPPPVFDTDVVNPFLHSVYICVHFHFEQQLLNSTRSNHKTPHLSHV